MKAATIADIVKDRWSDLPDGASWCEVDEMHSYFCIRPEAIHHTDVNGMLFHLNERTYEVCMVDRVEPAENENWLLVYAHPLEDNVQDMTEEEWHELYGDSVGQGGDRGSGHDLRVPSQVAARKR
jgi:hypothetical protein